MEVDVLKNGFSMSEYTVFIDESGCKQRAQTFVADTYDIGVAVGISVPKEKEQCFSQEIVSALQPLGIALSDDTHVTDISSDLQEPVRKIVYEIIRRYDAELYWQAISASGFQWWEVELTDAAVNSNKNVSSPDIAIVGNKDNPSAHALLIAGVMEKALADHDQITFMTDEVDAKTLKEAKAEVNDVFRSGPTTYTVNAYDKSAKMKLTGNIVSTCIGVEHFPERIWTLKTVPKSIGGVFAADVVSNALLYRLNTLARSGRSRLNDKTAICGFELAGLFRCADDEYPDVADVLYGLHIPRQS